MQTAQTIADQLTDEHIAVLRIAYEKYPNNKFAGSWLRDDCIELGQRYLPAKELGVCEVN